MDVARCDFSCSPVKVALQTLFTLFQDELATLAPKEILTDTSWMMLTVDRDAGDFFGAVWQSPRNVAAWSPPALKCTLDHRIRISNTESRQESIVQSRLCVVERRVWIAQCWCLVKIEFVNSAWHTCLVVSSFRVGLDIAPKRASHEPKLHNTTKTPVLLLWAVAYRRASTF